MPKTKIQYSNQIKFNASTQFVDYIRQAIVSNQAKDKFGKYPTQTEFIRGVIYQWIRKQTPHILIDDLKGGVPEIIERKKQGFSAPDESWYRGENAEYVKELLLSSRLACSKYINQDFISKIIDEHINRGENHRLLIWSLMNFEWWCKIFINGEEY